MKYLIPSTKRTHIIGETLDLLGKDNCYVYVHESEYDDYLKVVSNDVLKTHNVYGIGAIRKFMYEDNKDQDYIFQIDDDITSLEYKFSDKITIIVDSDHIKEVIDNAYQIAYDLGTPLFGLAAGIGPMLYTQLDHFYFSGFVNFVGAGIIPELMGSITFDPRFNVMHEDHDLTLQVKYFKRYVLIDGRYSIRSKKRNLNEGGLSLIRNTKEHLKCRNLLMNKFGNAVQPSSKREDKIVLRIGF
jgi:hypothetical protein